MRIPTTPIRTTWRADWLVEFSAALVLLAFLTREIIFAVVGAGILLILAGLGLLFHRGLETLRRELDVLERLSKSRVFLGDSIEGDLTIRNESRLAAQILAIRPVIERGLSIKLPPSFNQLLRPGNVSRSKFEVTSLESGRFRISGFTLAFTDARGLFTGEVNYEQDNWVEVYPGMRMKASITPLRLYGGSPEVYRKGPAGMDYAGIRQYAPGDEYHRVEWKATARLRTLMVKEFHPETRTMLQILIDAGRTMQEQSHVGTKLDEALAISRLLVESVVGSASRVGILVYDESRITKVMNPESAEQQMASLRELASGLLQGAPAKKTATRTPATFWNEGRPPRVEPLATFVQVLKLKLGSGHKNTGVHKAFEHVMTSNPDSVIILTDLLTNNEALLNAAQAWRDRASIVVAQICALWRLQASLEDAYVAYVRNSRILSHLQHLGLTVLDVRAETLVDRINTYTF